MKRLSSSILCLFAPVLLMAGCEQKPVMSNTSEYLRLHGIVNDGRTVNEIVLIKDENKNQAKLRFPEEFRVSVETPNTHGPNPQSIRKGYAYSASISLDITDDMEFSSSKVQSTKKIIGILQLQFGATNDIKNDAWEQDQIANIKKNSSKTVVREDLRLFEYATYQSGQHAGNYYYLPMDENFRAVDGRPILIGCLAANGPCAGSFRYLDKVAVTFSFPRALLAHWRGLYLQSLKITKTVLIK
ncbi:hypothetical protein H8L32_21420 [Undibacterium sp. CY18W]|uniref:Lipoprotein n=1 Tax=Undibacterium hunanense TaxID=2762292 RepID=A0ABR6ZVZ4_9BURK|nr:hypothetical protein [Undibacterium hunanense]MBC3920042.1 hypothetical protein [Undibacterium hunanense]